MPKKAQELEESEAYSEQFEESIGKSANWKDSSAGKDDKKLKMDIVQEESVDDSQSQSGVGSENQKTSSKKSAAQVESSTGSLPSEDVSYKQSVQSVEWKVDIPRDSVRQTTDNEESQKHTSLIREERVESEDEEEDIESSSDLNTRDEIQDLESSVIGNDLKCVHLDN